MSSFGKKNKQKYDDVSIELKSTCQARSPITARLRTESGLVKDMHKRF